MSKKIKKSTVASEPKRMTLILQDTNEAILKIAGNGTMTIDWGDGSSIQTHTLLGFEESEYEYCNVYDDCSTHIITITGENITHLNCSNNQLTRLDVSGNTGLTNLDCSHNRLKNLNVTKNTALTELDCSINQLTNLNVSMNTSLEALMCIKNQLTNLDVSKNIALTNLSCSDNQLKSMNVSKNTALTFLNCRKNQLSAEALNILFGTLNSTVVEGKILYILNNPGTKTCNQKIATDREWKIDTSLI